MIKSGVNWIKTHALVITLLLRDGLKVSTGEAPLTLMRCVTAWEAIPVGRTFTTLVTGGLDLLERGDSQSKSLVLVRGAWLIGSLGSFLHLSQYLHNYVLHFPMTRRCCCFFLIVKLDIVVTEMGDMLFLV